MIKKKKKRFSLKVRYDHTKPCKWQWLVMHAQGPVYMGSNPESALTSYIILANPLISLHWALVFSSNRLGIQAYRVVRIK